MDDRLTQAQRIRLEALSQAQNLTVITATEKPTPQHILENAKLIEEFIKSARE